VIMEINLILLVPNAMMLGWQYYERDETFEYSEFNLFLFFGQIQIRWE
jgi:hypothetical protein